jgi:dTDP-4-amino-4,6-dideoxy-D-galactose acyltransferase
MEIKYLEWDSDFFRKKIGRISVQHSDNIEATLHKAKDEGYQLIYAFGDKDFFVEDTILQQFGGHLADRKVVYEKTIKEKQSQSTVSVYESKELVPELESLAYESGKYSRFKLDTNFEKDDFYRMYKIWIENSINRQIADKIFVTKNNNEQIQGMLTLKITEDKGHIGLIAVSPNSQGRGYGKALISACENELLDKGIATLEVPTQWDNKQACKFYERCGFTTKEISNIYHFWL